ncbi:MAG: hypothetical protein ACLT5P_12905 [Flavonifractor plautii]
MKRIARYLLLAVLLWLLFLVLSMVIPPLVHKTAGPGDWEAEPEMTDAAPERVRSIDDNQDALLWRLRLIEAAQEQIILATFDFWDEEGGRDVMGALWNAAERGVEVQVWWTASMEGAGRSPAATSSASWPPMRMWRSGCITPSTCWPPGKPITGCTTNT